MYQMYFFVLNTSIISVHLYTVSHHSAPTDSAGCSGVSSEEVPLQNATGYSFSGLWHSEVSIDACTRSEIWTTLLGEVIHVGLGPSIDRRERDWKRKRFT